MTDTTAATDASAVSPQSVPAAESQLQDIVIRFAGNSQDGIQVIGGFLARLAGRTGCDVMSYMTIPSTISGGPSIFQVRLATARVLSAGDEADILVAFYQHSYKDNIAALRDGGLLIYDSDCVQPDPTEKRYRMLGVPITSRTVDAIGGTARDKGKNMFVLGLVARMLDLDVPKLETMLRAYYGSKGQNVVRNVLGAFHAGYGCEGAALAGQFRFRVAPRGIGRLRVVTDGNQAIAYGALAAGIRFGAGYPITPWSTIMETLRAELPKYGGIFVQAEDEMAAMAMACGAGYAGYVALTGTSGPGLSLKTEGIGWAVMAEVPVVIVNVQRGGPSTGLPTNVEQSDLNIACFGSHGDAPRIVLAPCSVQDCFYTMLEAVRLAREYSCPVIVLTDQALATRVESWDMPDFSACVQEIAPVLEPRGPEFKPYADTADGIARHAPPGTPIKGGRYPVVTGLEHDEYGHPVSRPADHRMMTAKRRRKLQVLASRLPSPAVFGPAEGDVLLVSWGSTHGSVCEAVERMQAAGQSVSALTLRHLMPLPAGLKEIMNRFRRVFVIELNDEGLYGHGQLASVLGAALCEPKVRSITKTDGLPFKVREILDAVQRKLAESSAQPAAAR